MKIWNDFLKTATTTLFGFSIASPALADDTADSVSLLRSRTEQIVKVLQGKEDPADVFDSRFLTAVPPAELAKLSHEVIAQGGPIDGYSDFQSERDGAATFTVRFRNATAKARIDLNPAPPQLVAGFRIFNVLPAEDNYPKLAKEFSVLPGKASFAVYRLTSTQPILLQGHEPERLMAIGSAFKLYVLAALARQIQEGTRKWSDVVSVSGKSFAGGIVHGLPEGSPITLHTLASLMISVSDNSASDLLIRLLGQDVLDQEVRVSGHTHPDALRPFLTTSEFFVLKQAGRKIFSHYAKADLRQRQAILQSLDTGHVPDTDVASVLGHAPLAIQEVEWFASAQDIASLLNSILALNNREVLDILAINPSMDAANRNAWRYVGYKGGSEDGVINQSWLLQNQQNEWFVISGTWNNTESSLPTIQFERLMMRVVKLATNPES